MPFPSTKRAHGWLLDTPYRHPSALRLFCLPYAGGSAYAYARWPALLPGRIDVRPIELPGRGSRHHEPAFSLLEPLTAALAQALAEETDRPYALFGHSMGALLAFELARALRGAGHPQPRLLLASAAPAPQLRHAKTAVHDGSDDQLIATLRTLGGIPEEVYADPDLLQQLLPAIRADFSVVETYRYREEPPLDCPIVGIAGAEDPLTPPAELDAWREQTTGEFVRHVLPGGHFFLRDSLPRLLDLIQAALADDRVSPDL